MNNIIILGIIVFVVIVTIVALVLSIISLTKKCKSDKFAGDILNESDCYNTSQINTKSKLRDCINTMRTLSTNIDSNYWGRADNIGLHEPSGAISGSFGNSKIIN